MSTQLATSPLTSPLWDNTREMPALLKAKPHMHTNTLHPLVKADDLDLGTADKYRCQGVYYTHKHKHNINTSESYVALNLHVFNET